MDLRTAHCTFEYQPLEKDAIRLLRLLPESTPTDISCSLHHQADYFDDKASYTAISYCWGEPNEFSPITVNGGLFLVTSNLWACLSALHGLFLGIGRFFWFDAICINQQNIEERNEQVHQMWRIFSCASTVISWLGSGDKTTDVTFDILGTMGSDKTGPRWELMDAQISRESIEGLASLFSNTYFGRTWTIAEMVIAATTRREHILACGKRTCYFGALKDRRVYAILTRCYSQNFPKSLAFLEQLTQYGLWHNSERKRRAAKYCFEILSVADCSDQRDRVFALLNVPLFKMPMKPDYSLTPLELLLEFGSLHQAVNWDVRTAGTALGVDLMSPSVYTSLQLRVQFNRAKSSYFIITHAGRVVDCSPQFLVAITWMANPKLKNLTEWEEEALIHAAQDEAQRNHLITRIKSKAQNELFKTRIHQIDDRDDDMDDNTPMSMLPEECTETETEMHNDKPGLQQAHLSPVRNWTS